MNALRNLGPVEAVRCVGSYLWVRVRPPKNQDTLEGFIAARFGWRLYQHFFKTYTEKVWGVPATRDLGRLGRAAGQGSVAAARRVGGGEAEAAAPCARHVARGHEPDRGVQVPEVRAGHDVGDRGREGHRRRRDARVRPARHARSRTTTAARTRSSPSTPTGDEHVYPCTHVISSMPLGALCRAMDPPVDDADRRSRGRAAVPRPPHGRARRVAGALVPRQLDLRARSRASRSGASRTTARGRRSW